MTAAASALPAPDPRPPRLTLRAGGDSVDLSPHGGCLLGWQRDGEALLRAAPPDWSGDPLQSANFPLVPWSNRIGFGRFAWRGQTWQLPPNFAPEPHAIHGVGWRRVWTVLDHTPTLCVLGLDHPGDTEWPWPFSVRQQLRLTDYGLTIMLEARNLADCAVPLGLGHHPWFERQGARLRFAATRVWGNDADHLPAMSAPPGGMFDFSAGAEVSGRMLDHCYSGWGGGAAITWAGRRWGLMLIASPGLANAVVYIPASGPAFCFEPVAHVTNALNRVDGGTMAMPVVAPGATISATLSCNAVAAAQLARDLAVRPFSARA